MNIDGIEITAVGFEPVDGELANYVKYIKENITFNDASSAAKNSPRTMVTKNSVAPSAAEVISLPSPRQLNCNKTSTEAVDAVFTIG